MERRPARCGIRRTGWTCRSLLKHGENYIEIHVFNTALNAWSAEPPHDYGPLKAKYGDRFQMQDLDKVQPVSSGLLGTIKLVEMEPGK